MKLETLHDLYLEELRDVYDAESQLMKWLPKLASAAANEDLKVLLQDHLVETRGHVQRLEEVFDLLDLKPHGLKCDAMEGLLLEARKIMRHDAEESVKDAGLIAVVQKLEHYEMAAYGCLRTWARLLGNEQQAEILQRSLNDEGQCDHQLTSLAERIINSQAVHA